MNGRELTLWSKDGEVCELLVDLKRRGHLFYLTRPQFERIWKAMFAKRDKPHIKLTEPWWMKHFLHSQ
eukprot:10308838-Prorocentrum_lima.AAC.1